MGIGCIVLICALGLFAAALLIHLLLLRHSITEVAKGLEDKLNTDTNTLISISSGDRAVRALAAGINDQLKLLRRERLRLQSGNDELKAAITNVSHDLRTPLTAMCGYLELMEREPQTENGKRYLAVIRERADAMRALSEELFSYSVTASAAEEPKSETVNVNTILEQSLIGFYGAMSARGIVPQINICASAVMRTADADALRRIFDNIISNAVKYSDGDFAVALDENGTATFTNGAAGLSRVQAERLFDRFFTVETARSSTGLGLSIAKQLTEKLGGSIRAEYGGGKLQIRLSLPQY